MIVNDLLALMLLIYIENSFSGKLTLAIYLILCFPALSYPIDGSKSNSLNVTDFSLSLLSFIFYF